MMPRIAITPGEIDRVIHQFYTQVRADPTLGPVFAAHVADWPSHEVKIAGFWRSALLGERSYNGNPMQKHMAAGNVQPAHFETWLGIFDQVLFDLLPTETAAAWSRLAHRIGQSLKMGLTQFGNTDPGVPSLT